MSETFCVYNKEEFERELLKIVKGLDLPLYGVQDITEGLIQKGFNTKERIYKIKTKQANKAIIIYSSLDIRTDRTRDIGSDALRVIIWLRTKQGDFFKSYKKHYRVQTLFQNLGKTIEEINSTDITSFKGYKKSLQYA